MNCLMNQNPKYYATVELDGKKIATIKAKTHHDEAEIIERCWSKSGNGSLDWKVNFEKANIIRIRQALTGDKKVGWDFDVPITEENISNLMPEIYNALLLKITELDKSWADGSISKN